MSEPSTMFVKFGFTLMFLAAGVLSTLTIWVLLSLTIREPFAIDSLGFWGLVAGGLGPIITWLLVRRFTRMTRASLKHELRLTSTVGLTAVLILEALYFVLLGIVYLAYDGVRM